MTDLIGDIYEHAYKLKDLLLKLGCTLKNESYVYPERKVAFVGNYTNRGPQIRGNTPGSRSQKNERV